MKSGRLTRPLLALGVLAAFAWPAAASGAEIVTWDGKRVGQSRFVDPSLAPAGHYNEPPGVPERPNALRANVYLPDTFTRDRRWPVLFLLHGQGDAFDSWAHPARGDLLDTAAGFPGIIVMPEGDRGFYTNWWNGGARGDPRWERYHLEQLVPLVERRLPIRRGRRWHAIAGLSMGGEGAMYYASQRPAYFGSAAAFSGPLSIQRPTYQQGFAATGQSSEPIWGDETAQEFYWRGHNPKELAPNLRHTRLYVAAGDGVPNPLSPDEVDNTFGQLAEAELGQHASEFNSAAEAVGAPISYNPHQGIHDWPYWRADLAAAIAWGFFERPPRPHREWSFETVARVGETWGIRFRFRRAPEVIERFERNGNVLRGEGEGWLALHAPGRCAVAVPMPFRIRLDRLSPAGRACPV